MLFFCIKSTGFLEGLGFLYRVIRLFLRLMQCGLAGCGRGKTPLGWSWNFGWSVGKGSGGTEGRWSAVKCTLRACEGRDCGDRPLQ